MIYIIFIIIAVFLIVLWWKSYKLDIYRSITAYTGGVGSGKTFLSVRQAIKCYKRVLKVWKRQKRWDWLRRRDPLDRPLLYSNIPIITKKFCSAELTPEIVLLQERIPQGSVVLIDEVSAFLNQFEYGKNTNVRLFDEFCRFFRQYINGNCIINDQCSSNVVLQIRRRLNTIYNLNKHRFFLGITTVKVREINISDEIIAVDEKDTNETYQRFVCFGNYFKRYQSRCYMNRYQFLPKNEPIFHDSLFTNKLFICPDVLFPNAIEAAIADASAVPTVSATSKEGGNVGQSDTEIDLLDLYGEGE